MSEPTIVVYLEGGLVQEVVADGQARVIIVDRDDDAATDHPSWCEGLEAFVHEESVTVSKGHIKRVIKKWGGMI